MARYYTIPFNISATTVQVDIFELKGAAGYPLRLHGFEIGQLSEFGDAQEEDLVLILKRITSAATSGSGGGTATARDAGGNKVATNITCETGNTTKLTGGTSEELGRFAWNVRIPYAWPPKPEFCPEVVAGDYIVLELGTTPADSIGNIVGTIYVEEMN